MAERVPCALLSGMRAIGVDEFSYRKRHRYLAVVVDHDSCRVVRAAKGRGADALAGLFEYLGEAGCAAIESVTMDMAGGHNKGGARAPAACAHRLRPVPCPASGE